MPVPFPLVYIVYNVLSGMSRAARRLEGYFAVERTRRLPRAALFRRAGKRLFGGLQVRGGKFVKGVQFVWMLFVQTVKKQGRTEGRDLSFDAVLGAFKMQFL